MGFKSEHVGAIDEGSPTNVESSQAPVADKPSDRLPGHVPKPRGFGLSDPSGGINCDGLIG